MYETYYGLREKPFSLTPDSDFLFINKHFRAALDNIIYGIERHEGFTAIVGDVGTGKTTLCWALLGRLDKSIRTALILNPLLNEEDMLKAILQDFGVRPKLHMPATASTWDELPYDPAWMQGLSRKDLIDELNCFLLAGSEEGTFNILIIDEAQNLSLSVLEQLRILSNLETSKKKLLQIIFVGQIEFRQKLARPELRQLDQRITTRYTLQPLSKNDMVEYIAHRLTVAGSRGGIAFTPGALRRIYDYSRGYPRLINIICDRSLLAGYSERARVINSRMVRKAVLGIRGRQNEEAFGAMKSWRLVFPLAALVVLAILTVLGYWIWRNSMFKQNVSGSMQPAALAAAQPRAAVPDMGDSQTEPQPKRQEAPPQAGPAGANQTIVAMPPAPVQPGPAAANPLKMAQSPPQPLASALPPEVQIADGRKGATTNGIAAEFTGKYLLQVHSLATKDQADVAISSLQQKGFSAFFRIEENPQGRSWYVVYVGPYDNLGAARERALELSQDATIHPIIRSY